jgi:hypothetical protein
MLITNTLTPIRTWSHEVQKHIVRVFADTSRQQPYLAESITDSLAGFIDTMRTDLWVNVESPYVDKVYRDSYYQYYATKLGSFSKDCIRLSFFAKKVEPERFRNPTVQNRDWLQKQYLGFLVIRPTPQNPIGRNVLSPSAFRAFDPLQLRVCQAQLPTTVNGVKLRARGFPHSAQDVETVTCAQTTLWATMEYFSHRYAEYRPVLPSTIVQQLSDLLVQRNLPAPGLSVDQLSFLLKQNGFAPRIYEREEYDYEPRADDSGAASLPLTPAQRDFDALLSCYVESGIPVLVAVRDNDDNGHAMLCIGHTTEVVDTANSIRLDKVVGYKQLACKKKKPIDNEKRFRLFDLDQIPRQFVFIDDNQPPYTRAPLTKPTAHYPTDAGVKGRPRLFDGSTGRIVAFVVPLYRKVYLEAFEAKQCVQQVLASDLLGLDDGIDIDLRLFLTSSRSYKDKVLADTLLSDDIRQTVMRVSLPKLIWVAELSNPVLIAKNQVFGVILLDATEADIEDQNALIFAVAPRFVINFAAPNSDQQVVPLGVAIGPFGRYTSNLN